MTAISGRMFLGARYADVLKRQCVLSDGVASCTGMYRSESRARDKSIRRNRQSPAKLRNSPILRELRKSFGLKKLPPHWQALLAQTIEQQSGGSQVRSIRPTMSSKLPCTGYSAANGEGG